MLPAESCADPERKKLVDAVQKAGLAFEILIMRKKISRVVAHRSLREISDFGFAVGLRLTRRTVASDGPMLLLQMRHDPPAHRRRGAEFELPPPVIGYRASWIRSGG